MKKSVVLIDDDEDVRDVIIYALETDGLHVIPFENGRDGYDGITKLYELPGLIIVDFMMPEMDGVTFIQTLRKNFPETLAKVPIAVCSAMGTSDSLLSKLEDVIHLNKPMDLDDLLKLAKEHCVLSEKS